MCTRYINLVLEGPPQGSYDKCEGSNDDYRDTIIKCIKEKKNCIFVTQICVYFLYKKILLAFTTLSLFV